VNCWGPCTGQFNGSTALRQLRVDEDKLWADDLWARVRRDRHAVTLAG
jgi:hypothetical protein